MPKPNVGKPRIRFEINGIIALCVREMRKTFDVGVVRSLGGNGDIPGHGLSIKIRKNGNPVAGIPDYDNGNPPPPQLSLAILDQPSDSGIQLFAPDLFNRSQRNDNSHFKWVLDVGNGELHSTPVNINRAALRSVLRVTGVESAIFFTDDLSRNRLRIRDKHGARTLGSIAGTVEALIPLPPNGAVFSDGGSSHALPAEHNVTYDITIRQSCSTASACAQPNIETIFRDLFRTGVSGEEIDIIDMTSDVFFVNPEIGCVGANFSANAELPLP